MCIHLPYCQILVENPGVKFNIFNFFQIRLESSISLRGEKLKFMKQKNMSDFVSSYTLKIFTILRRKI
jgi:hypothetical protein